MFDIYSLAKPRVFMMADVGGGIGSDTPPTPSETPAPDSVEYESDMLNEYISIISEDLENPETAGRVIVETNGHFPSSINIINAASDFGGCAKTIINNPVTVSGLDYKSYRTEFRPKQGLHNLDFTTPSETPSEDEGGGGKAMA